MKRDIVIGIDIGGTKLLCELITSDGRVLERRKEGVVKGARPFAIFKQLTTLIDGILAASPDARMRLIGIGAAVPGIVAPGTGKIVAAPNINLAGYPLAGNLKDRYRRPVVLGNDVNLALLAESWLGAARGKNDVVGLFPGTGVGGGVMVAGQLLTGAHGAGAELGHVRVKKGGRRCGCGKRGCLEAYASRTAIEAEIRKSVKKGGKTAVKKLNGGDLSRIRSKVLAKALEREDPLVTRVMRGAAKRLGAVCVSLRQVFDPEVFVFGGGLVEACGPFLLPIIQGEIDKDPFFSKVSDCRVLRTKLGDDAVAVGAARLLMLRGEPSGPLFAGDYSGA